MLPLRASNDSRLEVARNYVKGIEKSLQTPDIWFPLCASLTVAKISADFIEVGDASYVGLND